MTLKSSRRLLDIMNTRQRGHPRTGLYAILQTGLDAASRKSIGCADLLQLLVEQRVERALQHAHVCANVRRGSHDDGVVVGGGGE